MVFVSLVIDLIGHLNCHVIGYKTRKGQLVRFEPSIVLVGLFVSQVVSSVYCLSVLMSLLNRLYGVGDC